MKNSFLKSLENLKNRVQTKIYVQQQLRILAAARRAGSPLSAWEQWRFNDKMASGSGLTAPKPKGPDIQLTLFNHEK